jgi:hypothetical protein
MYEEQAKPDFKTEMFNVGKESSTDFHINIIKLTENIQFS